MKKFVFSLIALLFASSLSAQPGGFCTLVEDCVTGVPNVCTTIEGTCNVGGGGVDLLPLNNTWTGTNTWTQRGFFQTAFNVTGGAPAAGLGGSIVDISSTLNPMDGQDVTAGISLTLVNAAHTGSNTVLGLDLKPLATSSANEVGIRVNSGWDAGFHSPFGVLSGPGFAFTAEPNSGMFGATGTVAFATGGVEAFRLNKRPEA